MSAFVGASDDGMGRVDHRYPDSAFLHELLKSLQALGNETRLRFVQALRELHDGRLYFELGYPSFHAYCDREFGLPRSTASEYVRVATALDVLPRLRALFAEGDLSWDQVRSISRVATAATEADWIECACGQPVRVLRKEVDEALRTNSDRPLDRRCGLPNLLVRHVIELTIEERQRLLAAFAMVTAGPGPDLDGSLTRAAPAAEGDGDRRPALVRWADGILSKKIPAWPVQDGQDDGASAARPTPAQTVVYHLCPDCRRARLDTRDGPLAISPERVEELAPLSQRIVIEPREEESTEDVSPEAAALPIDAPNSASLTRKVHARDGERCANPSCGRMLNLHAHHIRFRAEGGRSELANEVLVCATCHALIHAGLLDVTGSPYTELVWTPRPRSSEAKLRDVTEIRTKMDAIGAPPGTLPDCADALRMSTRVDIPGGRAPSPARPRAAPRVDPVRVSDLAEGLRRWGWKQSDAEEAVYQAMLQLLEAYSDRGDGDADWELDEGEILLLAMQHRGSCAA